jgi:hypothetical protein
VVSLPAWSRTNGAFITDTVSPRSALKPTACFTSASMRVSSAGDSAAGDLAVGAGARHVVHQHGGGDARTRPAGWRVCCRVRSSS